MARDEGQKEPLALATHVGAIPTGTRDSYYEHGNDAIRCIYIHIHIYLSIYLSVYL